MRVCFDMYSLTSNIIKTHLYTHCPGPRLSKSLCPIFTRLRIVGRIIHALIHIPTCGVSSPSRERSTNTTSSRDSKSKQEQHHLCATVKTSGDKIVPLDEVFRSVFPQVELAEGSNVVVHEDARVDTNAKISKIPKNDGEVEIRPDTLMWEISGHDPEWNWDDEPKEI